MISLLRTNNILVWLLLGCILNILLPNPGNNNNNNNNDINLNKLFVGAVNGFSWPQPWQNAYGTASLPFNGYRETLVCEPSQVPLAYDLGVSHYHATTNNHPIFSSNDVSYYITNQGLHTLVAMEIGTGQIIFNVSMPSQGQFGSGPVLDEKKNLIYCWEGDVIGAHLVAFSATTGEFQWRQDFEYIGLSYPVILPDPEGYVVISTFTRGFKSIIYAIDGPAAPKQEEQEDDDDQDGVVHSSSSSSSSPSSLSSSSSRGPYGLADGANAYVKWSYEHPDRSESGVPSQPVAAPNQRVVILFSYLADSSLCSLDASSGTKMWCVKLDDLLPSNDVKITINPTDGTIYTAGFIISSTGIVSNITTFGSNVHAISDDGSLWVVSDLGDTVSHLSNEYSVVWEVPIQGDVRGLVVDGSKTNYVSDKDYNNKNNNKNNNQKNLQVGLDPVMTVYVSSATDPDAHSISLYALDALTGVELWKLSIPVFETLMGNAAIVGDGSLLVITGSVLRQFLPCSGHGMCIPKQSSSSSSSSSPSSPSPSSSSIPTFLSDKFSDRNYRGSAHHHHNNDGDGDDIYECSCDVHWYRDDCSKECVSCPERQECNDYGECVCQENYYPEGTCDTFCNETACAASLSGNGVCLGDGRCSCASMTFGSICQHQCVHGTINGFNGSSTCVCDPYYYGFQCESFCSDEIDCSGHGQCVESEDRRSVHCECNDVSSLAFSIYPEPECYDTFNWRPWVLIAGILVTLLIAGYAYNKLRNKSKKRLRVTDFPSDKSVPFIRVATGGDTSGSNSTQVLQVNRTPGSPMRIKKKTRQAAAMDPSDFKHLPPTKLVDDEAIRESMALVSPRGSGVGLSFGINNSGSNGKNLRSHRSIFPPPPSTLARSSSAGALTRVP